MECYGVDIAPIEQLHERLRNVPPTIMDLTPESAHSFAREYSEQLAEIEFVYLDAFANFLAITLAIAARRIELERLSDSELRNAPPPREYLFPFLKLFADNTHLVLEWLRALLGRAYAQQPALRPAFAANALATCTADEMIYFASGVRTANSVAEADDHGGSAKQIVDSVKKFLQEILVRIKLGPFKLKKEHVENGLHVLNEILGMVFKGLA